MSSRWSPPHIASCIVREHVILPPEPCGIREEERIGQWRQKKGDAPILAVGVLRSGANRWVYT